MQRKLLENKQQSSKLIEEVENLQSKIRLFAPEIERLNFNLKNKLEEGDRLQHQNRYLTTENEELKSKLRETPDLRSTLTTY
jgi:regulator of replication initiation timing